MGVAAISAVLASPGAAASDSDNEQPLEAIVAVGERAALTSALETKRESVELVDAVGAEEINELPDSNVGDALQRIAGARITRDRGAGSVATIHGDLAKDGKARAAIGGGWRDDDLAVTVDLSHTDSHNDLFFAGPVLSAKVASFSQDLSGSLPRPRIRGTSLLDPAGDFFPGSSSIGGVLADNLVLAIERYFAKIGALPVYTRAYSWVDASLTYRLTERTAITLEGLNLTRTVRRSYYGSETRPESAWINDTQIACMLSVRL